MILTRQRLNSLFVDSLCLLAFAMPFYRKVSTWSLVLVVAIFLVRVLVIRPRIKFPVLPLMGLIFFAVAIVGLVHTQNLRLGFFEIEKRLGLAIFPIIFLFTEITIPRKPVLKALVYGCAVTSGLCLVNALVQSIEIVGGHISFFPAVLNKDLSFVESITNGGNRFFGESLSIFVSPIYFAMYINLSIIAITYYGCKRGLNRYHLFGIGYFLVVLFLLSSKLGLLTILVFSIAIPFFLKGRLPARAKMGVGLFFILLLVATLTNPRIQSVFHEYMSGKLSLEKKTGYITSTPLRLMTWSASISIIERHPITGVGTGDMEDEMYATYRTLGFMTALKMELNCHNQFFEEIGRFGFLLGIVLPVMLISGFYFALRLGNILGVSFLILITINLLFESALERFNGVVFFSLFFNLLMQDKRSNLDHDV